MTLNFAHPSVFSPAIAMPLAPLPHSLLCRDAGAPAGSCIRRVVGLLRPAWASAQPVWLREGRLARLPHQL